MISIKLFFVKKRCVYPYEFMDEQEKFKETSLPEKKIYSSLTMAEITDSDYIHAKGICKDFEIKNLGQYHYLYLISNSVG